MRGSASGCVLACVVALSTAASAAEFAVGAGASVDLGTGALALGCSDLTVTGTLSAGGYSGDGSGLTGIDAILEGDTKAEAVDDQRGLERTERYGHRRSFWTSEQKQ